MDILEMSRRAGERVRAGLAGVAPGTTQGGAAQLAGAHHPLQRPRAAPLTHLAVTGTGPVVNLAR